MIINLFVIIMIISVGMFYAAGEYRFVKSRQTRKRYITIICAILILQSGLRNVAVGADTYAYYQQFEDVKAMSWSEIYEATYSYYAFGMGKDPGYLVFQKIAQIIFPNYQLFLLLIAIIFFSALGNVIHRNTSELKDAIFALVLYSCLFYSFFSITGHRQTIATAGVLYSYEFVKKRKILPFLVLILLASTIHRSCLVFIPLYFIANLNITRLLYGFIILVFPIVMNYKNAISEYLSARGGYGQYGSYEGAGTYTFTAMLLVVAVVGLLRMKYVMRINEQTRPLFNAFALAIFFTPLTWVNPSAMRVVQYFSIYLLLLIPIIIRSFQQESKKLRQWVYGISIILLIALFIKSNWGNEYKFFWQEMTLPENYF